MDGCGATWDVADIDTTFEVVCWSEVLGLVTLEIIVALRLRSVGVEGSDIDLDESRKEKKLDR